MTERGMGIPLLLGASALLALIAVAGFQILPEWTPPETGFVLTPNKGIYPLNNTFNMTIKVSAIEPVNVFAGELSFNEDVVIIENIDYNTSIADLWAEKPWYENGRGTMNFGGGTTAHGGFLGTGTLITLTFRTIAEGHADITLHDTRILRHDGLGTDVPQPPSIDTLLSIIQPNTTQSPALISVVKDVPSRDFNGDGAVTLSDASILMLNMLSYDSRYDLNIDGTVDWKDLELITTD